MKSLYWLRQKKRKEKKALFGVGVGGGGDLEIAMQGHRFP